MLLLIANANTKTVGFVIVRCQKEILLLYFVTIFDKQEFANQRNEMKDHMSGDN